MGAKDERRAMKEEILASKKVQEAMRAVANANGWTDAVARKVAGKIFEEMVRSSFI